MKVSLSNIFKALTMALYAQTVVGYKLTDDPQPSYQENIPFSKSGTNYLLELATDKYVFSSCYYFYDYGHYLDSELNTSQYVRQLQQPMERFTQKIKNGHLGGAGPIPKDLDWKTALWTPVHSYGPAGCNDYRRCNSNDFIRQANWTTIYVEYNHTADEQFILNISQYIEKFQEEISLSCEKYHSREKIAFVLIPIIFMLAMGGTIYCLNKHEAEARNNRNRLFLSESEQNLNNDEQVVSQRSGYVDVKYIA